jgi:hypothetical protein
MSHTEDLIHALSREAGAPRARALAARKAGLVAGAVIALAAALAIVTAWIGARPDLARAALCAPFAFKLAAMLALAAGALVLAWRTSRPGPARGAIAAVVPGLLVLALGVVTDRSDLPALGRSSLSAPRCVAAILVVSLPGLAVVLGVLRTGAPGRPWLAGAAAGLVAGALGAAAYTVACRNDGAWFAALWYPAAVLIVSGLGALVGRRVLAW